MSSSPRFPRRRTLLKLGAAALTTAAATPLTGVKAPAGRAALPVVLPAPTGHRPVGAVDLHLVDRSRPDPFVPSKPFRELMVSVRYPAEPDRAGAFPVAPWLGPAAAADWDERSAPGLGIPAGAVDWRGMRTHARTGAPADRSGGRLPVVLFSPGDGGGRALGTALVEELASRGYVVVSADSPYEADQVEFPGGRVERAVPLPDDLTPEVIAALLEQHARVRLADARFVLDRIGALARGQNPDAGGGPLPAGLPAVLDPSRTGVLGQSLGGSVAARLARDEHRVRAAVNLDGDFIGPIALSGVAKPFLLLMSEGDSVEGNPGWASFWAASTGWRRALRLRDAQHGSYTDLQVVLPQLTGHLELPAAVGLIGTIDPLRSLAAQRAAVTAFFDRCLKGRPTSFFEDPGGRFPEWS
ncbi:alpha/beta hydrolase family protein [Streptomyces sp. NPDC101490]|uniref:alpha/beta hydrolase family protein n=1 Tax=Streptomyces sp. NPDC101490 TaxID=3366143 RepID=UPI0038069E1B